MQGPAESYVMCPPISPQPAALHPYLTPYKATWSFPSFNNLLESPFHTTLVYTMPPSIRSVLAYSSVFFLQTSALQDSYQDSTSQQPLSDNAISSYVPLSGAPSCPIDGPTSCQNSTDAGDSCCFVYPGGRMLLTQFWDAEVHAGGSDEDWTIHGLWYVFPSSLSLPRLTKP
jgi:hypothetical protein